ncbi:hypothetical protein SAMN04488012_1274 [Palleronia salina]|uniref:Hemolysin-type calcium-binding repeat-containing protein n=1 Tax=Palleronia salina TaxID=313368 RepID=A0A1M6MEX7_9RHOB|nr:hypothetical protein [Palleronia salina]SHJ81906.1 hypothetical protein SAMN04488012_1274 [Palleronia salina]
MENEDVPGDTSTTARLTVGVPFTSDFDSVLDADWFLFSGTPGAVYAVEITMDGTTTLLTDLDLQVGNGTRYPNTDPAQATVPSLFFVNDTNDLWLDLDASDIEASLGLTPGSYTVQVVERPDLALLGTVGNDTLTFDPLNPTTLIDGRAGTDTVSFGDQRVSFFLTDRPENNSLVNLGNGTIVKLKSIEAVTVGDSGSRFDISGGSFQITGGAGQESFSITGAGQGRVFNGGANPVGSPDQANYNSRSNTDPIAASLLTGMGTAGVAAGDTYIGIELLRGTEHNDTLAGSNAADTLFGNIGDDILTGNGGNDRIDGDTGTDVAVFNFSRSEYTVTETDGFSPRSVYYTVSHSGADGTDSLRDVEILRFADGDFVPGSQTGTAGNDWMVWNGTSGRVFAGDGTDMLSFVNEAAVRVDLLARAVTVSRPGSTDIVVEPISVEAFTGTSGNDVMIGGTGDGRLRGLGGNDRFIGSRGTDTIDGGAGGDSLSYITDSLSGFAQEGVNVSLFRGMGWTGNAAGDLMTGIENLSGTINDVSCPNRVVQVDC